MRFLLCTAVLVLLLCYTDGVLAGPRQNISVSNVNVTKPQKPLSARDIQRQKLSEAEKQTSASELHSEEDKSTASAPNHHSSMSESTPTATKDNQTLSSPVSQAEKTEDIISTAPQGETQTSEKENIPSQGNVEPSTLIWISAPHIKIDAPSSKDLSHLSPPAGWGPPRITTSHEDVYDFEKTCPYTFHRMLYERPDFKGGKSYCFLIRRHDDEYSDMLSDEKKERLIKEILPKTTAFLTNITFTRKQTGPLIVPKYNNDSICSHFNISKKHHTDGLNDTDVVLYVAAGPMPENERSAAVWAEKCTSGTSGPLVFAVNFNPRNISVSANIVSLAVSAISNALGVSECNPERTTESDNSSGQLQIVHRTCVGDVKKEEDKTKDRTTEESITRSVDGDKKEKDLESTTKQSVVNTTTEEKMETVAVLTYENDKLSSSFRTYGPIRIATSSLDVVTWKKYCPETADTWGDLRKDFNGNKIRCQIKGNINETDTLTLLKRETLQKEILPELTTMFASGPYIRRVRGPLWIPNLHKTACSKYEVLEEHRRNGVPNTDVMLLVSAGPMMQHARDEPVRAVPCAYLNGFPSIIAVNFNPARIMNTSETFDAAVVAVRDALGVSQCPESNALMVRGTSDKGKHSNFCVGVKCEGEGTLKVQVMNEKMWRSCKTTISIMSSNTHFEVNCTHYKDMCKSEEKQTMPSRTLTIMSSSKPVASYTPTVHTPLPKPTTDEQTTDQTEALDPTSQSSSLRMTKSNDAEKSKENQPSIGFTEEPTASETVQIKPSELDEGNKSTAETTSPVKEATNANTETIAAQETPVPTTVQEKTNASATQESTNSIPDSTNISRGPESTMTEEQQQKLRNKLKDKPHTAEHIPDAIRALYGAESTDGGTAVFGYTKAALLMFALTTLLHL